MKSRPEEKITAVSEEPIRTAAMAHDNNVTDLDVDDVREKWLRFEYKSSVRRGLIDAETGRYSRYARKLKPASQGLLP